MKKHLAIMLSLLLVLMGMSACADNTGQNNHNNSNNNGGGTTPPAVTAENVLIAYFSCTGTTAGIAERIAEETGGTLHEIQPAVPYTPAASVRATTICTRSQQTQIGKKAEDLQAIQMPKRLQHGWRN